MGFEKLISRGSKDPETLLQPIAKEAGLETLPTISLDFGPDSELDEKTMAELKKMCAAFGTTTVIMRTGTDGPGDFYGQVDTFITEPEVSFDLLPSFFEHLKHKMFNTDQGPSYVEHLAAYAENEGTQFSPRKIRLHLSPFLRGNILMETQHPTQPTNLAALVNGRIVHSSGGPSNAEIMPKIEETGLFPKDIALQLEAIKHRGKYYLLQLRYFAHKRKAQWQIQNKVNDSISKTFTGVSVMGVTPEDGVVLPLASNTEWFQDYNRFASPKAFTQTKDLAQTPYALVSSGLNRPFEGQNFSKLSQTQGFVSYTRDLTHDNFRWAQAALRHKNGFTLTRAEINSDSNVVKDLRFFCDGQSAYMARA